MTYIEKNPDIRVAQVFQEKYAHRGIDGVIILMMVHGKIMGRCNYGNTKPLCKEYRMFLDELVDGKQKSTPPAHTGGA